MWDLKWGTTKAFISRWDCVIVWYVKIELYLIIQMSKTVLIEGLKSTETCPENLLLYFCTYIAWDLHVQHPKRQCKHVEYVKLKKA